MAETHTPDAVNIAGFCHNPVGWVEIYVADMQRAKDF
jgi:predicted enzyme related to lactoylglutathione lyase